jgi:hypothetical protein
MEGTRNFGLWLSDGASAESSDRSSCCWASCCCMRRRARMLNAGKAAFACWTRTKKPQSSGGLGFYKGGFLQGHNSAMHALLTIVLTCSATWMRTRLESSGALLPACPVPFWRTASCMSCPAGARIECGALLPACPVPPGRASILQSSSEAGSFAACRETGSWLRPLRLEYAVPL